MADPVPPMPPPATPPMADEAPDYLVRFIFNLTRDFIPVGVVQSALYRATHDTFTLGNDGHAKWCEEVARTLMYKPES